MTRLKKPGIVKEIDVSELKSRCIDCCDIESVSNLATSLRKKCNMYFFISLVFSLLFSLRVVHLIKTDASDTEFFMCMFIISLFISVNLLFKSFKFNIKRCKKAQYGIVSNKYSIDSYYRDSYSHDYSSVTTSSDYVVNVKFPLNNTCLKKVNCTKEVYGKIAAGRKVLVVSFDNKKAFVVLSKHKKQ